VNSLFSRVPSCVRIGAMSLAFLLAVTIPGVGAQDTGAESDNLEIDSLFETGDETVDDAPDGSPDGESADDIDSLFDDPDATNNDARTPSGTGTNDVVPDRGTDSDSNTESDSETGVIDIAALTTAPTKISASVSAGVGAGVGLIEWPLTSAADGRTIDELLRYSGFYNSSASMSVDTRPTSYLRFRTSIGTALDPDTMGFRDPSIGEFFIDYTLRETIFFRAGRQGLTWGQGRLLGNPANIVSDVSGGAAVRGTAPLGQSTVTGVVYSREEWVQERASIDPRAFAWAGQWEGKIGEVSIALAGKAKTDEPIDTSVSVSFALGPINVAGDIVRHVDYVAEPDILTYDMLGQLFWENEARTWSVLGEYRFDSSVKNAGKKMVGDYAGIGLRMPGVRGGAWRPALSWQHAFEDHSGQVTAGIGGTIAPSLSLSIGVPVIYGEPGSYYRAALEEEVNEDIEDRDDDAIPVDNVVSVLLAVGLSFSF